ncbi:uncharacterized protein LOC142950684 [Anarhichas minor]|uniref:uncharacterized protein LOC142950684 n=1 Tax=Anarhichas minor TaxID=65739 RepID=UPI003F732866
MAMLTLCTVVAALRVLPDRSQFFQYESVSLSCGQEGTSPDWRVKRNTSTNIDQECSSERTNESHCFIEDLYPLDNGAYWCESAAGGCSDAVNIMVTAGLVILESPVLPVTEGDDVSLRCRTKSTSNLTANFYKDGVLIGSSSTGNITVPGVSQADEGLYKCAVSGAGGSSESWLTVRGEDSQYSEIYPGCVQHKDSRRDRSLFASRPTCGISVVKQAALSRRTPPSQASCFLWWAPASRCCCWC